MEEEQVVLLLLPLLAALLLLLLPAAPAAAWMEVVWAGLLSAKPGPGLRFASPGYFIPNRPVAGGEG